MSKHVGRKRRWAQLNAKTYSSPLGRAVYERGAWYGKLEYRTRTPPEDEGGLATWERHDRQLGPFKRPRDAMVAIEREVTFLRNHHGKDVLLGDEVWAEAEPGR